MFRIVCLLMFVLVASPAAAACSGNPGPAKSAVNAVILALGNIYEENTCVFYGDYTGDGRDDALVFLYYAVPNGGNAVNIHVEKLRFRSGKFRRDGAENDIFGFDPQNVSFKPGQITFTTLIQGPNDPRCCPTKRTAWTIRTR